MASLTFVAAGFMAAGLARLQEIGRETGVDWRNEPVVARHRAGVLAIFLAIGVPGAYLLGLPSTSSCEGSSGRSRDVIVTGSLRSPSVAAILSTALYEALTRLGIALPAPMTPGELARLPEVREYTIEELSGPIMTVAILWAAIALLAVSDQNLDPSASRWGRRSGDEERSFSIPQRSFRLAIPRIVPPSPRRPGVRRMRWRLNLSALMSSTGTTGPVAGARPSRRTHTRLGSRYGDRRAPGGLRARSLWPPHPDRSRAPPALARWRRLSRPPRAFAVAIDCGRGEYTSPMKVAHIRERHAPAGAPGASPPRSIPTEPAGSTSRMAVARSSRPSRGGRTTASLPPADHHPRCAPRIRHAGRALADLLEAEPDEALEAHALDFGPPVLVPPRSVTSTPSSATSEPCGSAGTWRYPKPGIGCPSSTSATISEMRGPGEPVWAPRGSSELDYELEVAA